MIFCVSRRKLCCGGCTGLCKGRGTDACFGPVAHRTRRDLHQAFGDFARRRRAYERLPLAGKYVKVNGRREPVKVKYETKTEVLVKLGQGRGRVRLDAWVLKTEIKAVKKQMTVKEQRDLALRLCLKWGKRHVAHEYKAWVRMNDRLLKKAQAVDEEDADVEDLLEQDE